MQDRSKFTLSELKRIKRQLARRHSKLKRKVETMTNLHQSIADLRRQSGYLQESLVQMSDPSYNPPERSFKD